MKKYIDISLIYEFLAMTGGVSFREFTKYNSFDETTTLGKAHVHLFLLGMIVYLLVASFNKKRIKKTLLEIVFP